MNKIVKNPYIMEVFARYLRKNSLQYYNNATLDKSTPSHAWLGLLIQFNLIEDKILFQELPLFVDATGLKIQPFGGKKTWYDNNGKVLILV